MVVAVGVLPADASAADDGGPVGGHWRHPFGMEGFRFASLRFGSGLVAAGCLMVGVTLVMWKLVVAGSLLRAWRPSNPASLGVEWSVDSACSPQANYIIRNMTCKTGRNAPWTLLRNRTC